MARRYHVDPLPAPGEHPLPSGPAHHLARVLRARAGDAVRLFDGRGRESTGVLTAVSAREVRAALDAPCEVRREPRVALDLGVALPKGARAEWLFEHGTEVGIAAFWPLTVARGPRAERGPARRERWQRIVTAAAGQCDRSHLPVLNEPLALADWLDGDLPDERYVAVPGASPMRPARAARAALLVGPEGGLTEAEVELATARGFAPRGLGPLTLRVETAALCGAAILLG